MSINKLALIRYKTIDTCLQNRQRKWTLNDLVEACANTLYEYEGDTKGISKRTIQLDLQNMRSEKLGYNAPIIVTDKKYYTYEDKNYSITNSPVTQQDLVKLNEVLDVLKQFKDFGFFQDINSMIMRLENKLLTQKNNSKSFIHFEKNDLVQGLSHIDGLHKAIINQQPLLIDYQSFKAKHINQFILTPYLLKEYRNRWFLLGSKKKNKEVILLALDRIKNFQVQPQEKYVQPDFDVFSYFDDVIGVSKTTNQKSSTIVFKIDKEHAPYIMTKPLHSSQQLLKKDEEEYIFTLKVIWNFELERELLGFGEKIKVLSPKRLREKIQARAKDLVNRYK